jgi:predicted O-methyltransferase YrrM
MRFRKFRAFLVWIGNVLFDAYFWSRSQHEFMSRLQNVHTPADAVDLVYAYRGAGFYNTMLPNQDKSELTALAQRVESIAPKVIVEIGTRGGGTLFTWSQCSDHLELLVSIDLPGGIHGGGYPAARARLYKAFLTNHPSCALELLQLDSQEDTTKARLADLLHGRPIDFLFIDGDHRYEGVKRDYELYAPLVRSGGLIAFHDIRPNTKDASIQVFRLWDELRTQVDHAEEIVNEPYRGRYGIGLIVKR